MHFSQYASLHIEKKQIESHYTMRFLNGTIFLNHSVIMSGFLDSWSSTFEGSEKSVFLEKLEMNLNKHSELDGELKLTIPMVYLEYVKQ
jgi:hypothetical protein